jgi:phospholipid transport system substrate-binding protein
MNRFTLTILTALAVLLTLPAAAGKPANVLETDIQKILSVLKDPALEGESKREQRRDAIRKVLSSRFDFTKMSLLAIGRQWRNFSNTEREEFTRLFRRLLENTYIDKMEQYTDEKVTIVGTRELGNNKVSVETEIKIASGEVPILYKMFRDGSDWKVYDVNIEGVGLIKNYRSQFKEILYKDSVEALLDKLREKINNA